MKSKSKKIKSMNKKLQEEAMTTKDLLQTSSNMVAQLIMLMPKKNRIDNELRDSLPQTLKDSLENVQCEVSALLKSNYMITLESMRADKQFMDSAIVYFVTNQKHIADITNYVNVGQELIQRLRNSGVDCAIGYAADIENEINTFLLSIENADSSGSNIAEFIVNNLFWMIPVLLLLIAGIILVIKKTGKPKQ